MAKLVATDSIKTTKDLIGFLVWDDDEDPDRELKSGIYKTGSGEWRRLEDGKRWRFWEDPEIAAELR